MTKKPWGLIILIPILFALGAVAIGYIILGVAGAFVGGLFTWLFMMLNQERPIS
jgi:hypothetical protein